MNKIRFTLSGDVFLEAACQQNAEGKSKLLTMLWLCHPRLQD